MDITYLGLSSFKIRGKAATVVTDPFSQEVGLPYPKVSADIVLSSHDHFDHNAVERVSGTQARPEPMVITAPGEYEVQGVSVFGTASFHDDKQGEERGKNTIFRIHVDEVVVAHLGDLGHVLSTKQVEEINGVDVLLIPVGGVYTIDSATAVKVIEQVEPAIVIPMHYKTKGMASSFDKVAGVDVFLKEVGADSARRETKLALSKGNIPEDREFVVLEK